MSKDRAWANNELQFSRLLSEIRAVGLTQEQMGSLMISMDLSEQDIKELFRRAEQTFEWFKAHSRFFPRNSK